LTDKTPVAIQRIANDDVESAVFGALDLIGAASIMREGMTILLKANLLSANPPERAVCTHPAIVTAVIHWLKQFSPARIVLSDSTASISVGSTEKVLKVSGLKETCEREGAEAIPIEKMERTIYTVPDPLVLKSFPSATLIGEADLIINLPKIKTHNLTILTCCIKNMFGTIILGQKPKTHVQFPLVRDFEKALVDIYSVSKPQLTVVDGYLCQEGYGPSAGDIVKLDLVLAGFDGVALDTVVANITGVPVNRLYYLEYAEQKGLGTAKLDGIEVRGESIEAVKHAFKLPKGSTIGYYPVPLPRSLARRLGPALMKATITFDPKRCRRCGTCWKNCPVQAITPPASLAEGNVPSWNRNKCITCYCCAETCPYEAVRLNANIAKNFFTTWPGLSCVATLVAIIVVIALLAYFLL
jgi:uncharacterized protein (DUF362 family)/ferredoxin